MGHSRNTPEPWYIGSANVTRAGIGGQNLELGILVRGNAVTTVEKVLDLFRA